MKRSWLILGLVGTIVFIYIAVARLLQPTHETNPQPLLQKQTLLAPVKQSARAFPKATKTPPETRQSSPSEGEELPTVESVLKRLPPSRLELELPTNADTKTSMDFAARYGMKALGQVRAMQRLREVVEREADLRQREQALWEGMALAQVVEQMGNPRAVNTVAKRPVWTSDEEASFSEKNFQGQGIELIYSTHKIVFEGGQKLGMPDYKVFRLFIDSRGTLTKWEWLDMQTGGLN